MPKIPAPVVGMDVAKATLDLASPLDNGKYRTRGKLSNSSKGFDQLLTWLKTHAQDDAWVVLEATNVYHLAVATFLYQHGYRVCVANPRSEEHRLNSSHVAISYAVFCLKKKKSH